MEKSDCDHYRCISDFKPARQNEIESEIETEREKEKLSELRQKALPSVNFKMSINLLPTSRPH